MALGIDQEQAADRHAQRMISAGTFQFECPTRIVFGIDQLDALGDLARQLGARRTLIVSDPGIRAVGHTDRGQAALERAGITCGVFDGVQENPTTDHVEAGQRVAAEFEPDLIVGLGGGSSMDCAKGINFLYTNGGRMHDYWGVGKATQPMLPMIAVPTTAGTGSETQSFALISDAKSHQKMACGDKKAAFRIAVLDPKLTLTQPPSVTALTGIDAITHALETLVTTKRSPLSQNLSRESWRLLHTAFPRVLDKPSDVAARAEMQIGACLAGLAIENSMLGAAHALANPLTANCGTPHGQAVGLMLPHVIRFNAAVASQEYAWLDGVEPREPAQSLAARVTQLLEHAQMKTRLVELGMDREALPNLAKQAAQQWTAQFNPRPVTESELLQLYQQAWS